MTEHDDLDIAWDEDRGGTRNPLNLISFPNDCQFYKSTKKVFEWAPCGSRLREIPCLFNSE